MTDYCSIIASYKKAGIPIPAPLQQACDASSAPAASAPVFQSSEPKIPYLAAAIAGTLVLGTFIAAYSSGLLEG